MARIKRIKFNLKRTKAGAYTSPDGKYYAVRLENGWWSVGSRTPNGDEHIEDYESYAKARFRIVQLLGFPDRGEIVQNC